MTSNKSKSSKRKFIWLTVLVITVIIGVTGFIFKRDIYVKYYNLTQNHFERGDKVYLSKGIIDLNGLFPLYRLARPLSTQDIEEMNIDKLEKQTLINKLDNTLKPYLVDCGERIDIDTLAKYKSAYLGTYIYHRALYFKDYTVKEELIFLDNAYAIEPDYRGYKQGFTKDYYLPKGYTWADNTVYLPANWADNKEYNGFKKLMIHTTKPSHY